MAFSQEQHDQIEILKAQCHSAGMDILVATEHLGHLLQLDAAYNEHDATFAASEGMLMVAAIKIRIAALCDTLKTVVAR